jgi:hypothetical protein
MRVDYARRLAAPVLAAALLLAPALRLVCDTVCAEPPAPAAAHCAGGDPSDPAHGSPAGKHERPGGCRHSADVVLAKTFAGTAAGSDASFPVGELITDSLDDRMSHALRRSRPHHPPPLALPGAVAVLRL